MVSLRSGQSKGSSPLSRRHIQNAIELPSSSNSPVDEPQAEATISDIKREAERQPTFERVVADRGRSVTTAPQESHPIDAVGRGVKELVHAINKIEQLGIAKVAGDTPKIVVIGDQSAGKSSVINAISGIQVPRSTGTCTRCPMKITLTADHEPGAPWRCDVTLRKEYAYAGETAMSLDGKLPPFHPWIELDEPTTTIFKSVHNKAELQNVILHAQLATLNPRNDPMSFVPTSSSKIRQQTYQVEFSPNLVCLDISAPELPDLAFFDLPGVISQIEDGEKPYLIKLVKQLVKKYISEENALVLLACSMENDIQNSSAAGLARKNNAEKRCIGILTKPDRLPRGDPTARWESILKNESFILGHGYHVVKNPSQRELDEGMDHAHARRAEHEFFERVLPWPGAFSKFKDLFGTEKLQSRLSIMLAAQILRSLPTIHSRVQEKLADIDGELEHLPEPPTTDALRIVLDSLSTFTTNVTKQMEGDYPYNEFRTDWKDLRTQFRNAVSAQRPKLTIVGQDDAETIKARSMRAGSALPASQASKSSSTVIDLDSDAEPPRAVEATPTKKRKLPFDSTPSTPSRRSTGVNDAKSFKLDEIRSSLDNLSSSDIPGEIDPKALNYLRLQTLEKWDKPTSIFLDAVEEALKITINKALNDALKAWNTTDLYKETRKIALQFLSVAFHEQREGVAPRALRLERYKPMTENAEALEYNEKGELEVFKQARIRARTNMHFNALDEATGKQTPSAEKQRKLTDANFQTNTLGPDPYAREIEAMSKVRGYYNIASMRFIDHICQSLQAELFEKLRTELKHELTTVLGVYDANGGQNTCIRLLAEDPGRERRRQALQADRAKLVAALECLKELDQKYQDASSSGRSTLYDHASVDRNTGNLNGAPNGHSGYAGPSHHAYIEDDDEMVMDV